MANRLLSFIDFKEREVDLSVIDGTEVNQRHCSSQGVLDLLPMLSNLLGPACSGAFDRSDLLVQPNLIQWGADIKSDLGWLV